VTSEAAQTGSFGGNFSNGTWRHNGAGQAWKQISLSSRVANLIASVHVNSLTGDGTLDVLELHRGAPTYNSIGRFESRGGHWVFALRQTNGLELVSPPVAFSLGTWHTVQLTYDASAQAVLRGFIDGAQVASLTDTTTGTVTLPDSIYVGAREIDWPATGSVWIDNVSAVDGAIAVGPPAVATATSTPTLASTPRPTASPSPTSTLTATSTPPPTATPSPSATSTRTATRTPTSSGAPQVLNLSAPQSATFNLYDEVEWTFDLSKAYVNPYYFYDPQDTPASNPSTMTWFGQDGVSVDMHLTSPNGKQIDVPAFWMESYSIQNDTNIAGGLEVLGRRDMGHWHLRFAPSESGTYSYYITAQDKTGTGTSASGSMSITTTPENHGFVRTSPVDSRFMRFDDGTSYIPISAGHQWWANATKSYDYSQTFQTFGSNGINQVRVWDQSDFALSVEGADQQQWLDQCCTVGAAQSVSVGTAHTGLRAAYPQPAHGWYQRVLLADPNVQHTLDVWVKTNAVTTPQINVRNSDGFNTGTLLAQIPGIPSTQDWTEYKVTFTPNASLVTVNLAISDGQMYVDDMFMGPTGGYNALTDPDFERHFAKSIPNDDPDANPALPRPIGTYFNQTDSFELDKIISAAEAHGVEIQLCSCSGPWFTWPQNPEGMSDADTTQAWLLKSWERNFRYRVARWGYATSVLAFENRNETGHINPSGTPGSWALFTALKAYKQATDPYGHEETSSQNAQAYSPQMWSELFTLANYHWYLDGHLPSLDSDEALTVSRFAWCLRDIARGSSSPYCQGLGLGDGTSWSDPAEPWLFGEFDLAQGENTGTAGAIFNHNVAWAGLFTPIGTVPIDWYWNLEDSTAMNGKLLSRRALSAFWKSEAYDSQNFTFLTTANDAPPGYTGETIASSDGNARVYGMRSADTANTYLWVQNRAYTWQSTSTRPISPTITVGGLANKTYTVEVWDTTTGTIMSSTRAAGPSVRLTLSSLSTDQAVKIKV
jgi:hypothetical protein